MIRHATRRGLSYVQHVIALRVPIEGDTVVVQAGPGELAELRDAHASGLPLIVSVHADVCLFAASKAGVR